MKMALRTLAGGLVAALALTGCANDPKVAGTVDGVQISEAQVDALSANLSEGLQAPEQKLRRVALLILVRDAIGDKLAAENHITVKPADRTMIYQQVQDIAALAQNERTLPSAEMAADFALVANEMGQEKFFDAVKKIDVQLNRQYGTWNPESVTMEGTGSISKLAAETETQK